MAQINKSGSVERTNITKTVSKLSDQGHLTNIVEDTTPQLGGDLDLNSKNIDFPTTANISDCLDEDNMVSDSAVKLSTQQAIKAYVDNTIANLVVYNGGVVTYNGEVVRY